MPVANHLDESQTYSTLYDLAQSPLPLDLSSLYSKPSTASGEQKPTIEWPGGDTDEESGSSSSAIPERVQTDQQKHRYFADVLKNAFGLRPPRTQRAHKLQKASRRCKANNAIVAMDINDLSEEDVIIAVMGPTGSGKSTFINMATGNQDGVGHALTSFTSNMRIIKYHIPERSSLDIVFLDTPGFDDTYKSDLEVLKMIAEWLKTTYQKNIKLSGILYFHRITDNRMTGTTLKNLRMFEYLCGKSALQNIILTTTMWDEIVEDIGLAREKELKKSYWKALLKAGSKVSRFHNSRESAWNILDGYLESANQRYAMMLQTELVDMQKQLAETKAGQQLYLTLSTLVKRQQEKLRQIQQEMLKHQVNEAYLSSLRQDYKELRIQLVQAVDDMGTLKITPGKRLRHFISLRWKLP